MDRNEERVLSPLPAVRIAMWSGPRNISTALMRSWGSREDTVVCDEPLYAYYLKVTRLDHPGRDEIIAAGETDWRVVVRELTGEIPTGKRVFYQKHMAHHLLPDVGRDWLDRLIHVFLVRDPRDMLISLAKITPRIQIEDTGLPQQWEIFRRVADRSGTVPPVLDARDVLLDPSGVLKRLCARVGVPFDRAMLTWEPGPRSTDGIWAKYWYHAVQQSTGFKPYEEKTDRIPVRLDALYTQCRVYYDRIVPHCLRAESTEG